ncbi:hypothetical protein E4U42_000632 [Claviceps africana]|uniref:FAD dependent oxidoreductase domain-containing protein n=1 Tax=Claviceps africana TaxID=83212 RepID=A0A8K0NHQ2_9HYPO|nr:hypothetical protein E4U42_000632 [Claviceps africana]
MSPHPTIVIIGAGVLGLSTAVHLQARLQSTSSPGGPPTTRPRILLVAKEWPADAALPDGRSPSPDYASMWAGAHVRPIPAATTQLRREAKWLRSTVAEFRRQVAASGPACGVTPARGVELLDAPDASYRDQDAAAFAAETALSGYRKLQTSEVPEGVELGYEYDTFCVNPPVYCAGLLRRFLLGGGTTLRQHLRSEWEAFCLADHVELVVNASGAGFCDENVIPTRGQTVLTDVDVPATVTRQHADGIWSFLIPRFLDGGTIVGGTKQPGDMRSTPCPDTRAQLLTKGLPLQPLAHARGADPPAGAIKTIEDVGVLSDAVGRRPTRTGGMRLEMERRGSLVVIHAYGAGGRGYEMSWGIAEEVVDMAVPLVGCCGSESGARGARG